MRFDFDLLTSCDPPILSELLGMIGERTQRAVWVAVAMTSGCDLLFQLDHLGPSDSGGSELGVSDNGTSADTFVLLDCTSPVLFDDFGGGDVCGPWGDAYTNNATLEESGGALVATPQSTSGSIAGCSTKTMQPLGAGGVIVEVTDIGRGNSTYTMLELDGPIQYLLKATGDGLLRFQTGTSQDIATTLYSNTRTRWWRLRNGGNALVAEFSSDAATWTVLHHTAADYQHRAQRRSQRLDDRWQRVVRELLCLSLTLRELTRGGRSAGERSRRS
jgi:hypothetical protein